MDLYLVRHGETQANADGIVQGWLDTELNAQGLRQVDALVGSFDTRIDAIYSSDLKRATQTAQKFRDKLSAVPYFEDERLRERNFGDAEGTRSDQHDWEMFWASTDLTSIPNAEPFSMYNERIQSFLEHIKQQDFRTVLVISHGGTINQIQMILGASNSYTPLANASITHITLGRPQASM